MFICIYLFILRERRGKRGNINGWIDIAKGEREREREREKKEG